MRATDSLQTTITFGPVKDDGQAFSLELSLSRRSRPVQAASLAEACGMREGTGVPSRWAW